MAFRVTKWTILRATDPADFKRQVTAVLEKHGGNAVHAAQDMGVGINSLKRWVQELALAPRLDAVRQAAARARVKRPRRRPPVRAKSGPVLRG